MKKIIASNHFIKAKKKASTDLQLEIDRQVKLIISDPLIGEMKTGDLKGIRVYKSRFQNQQYLISYKDTEDILFLYFINMHENYYKKLKKYLRSSNK